MTATSDRPGTTSDESAQARRAEAIDTSGWGAPFHLLQPHNACFWVYLLWVGAGIWHVVGMVAPTAGIFAVANATAFATSGLFGVAFLLFLRWADRWEHTPALLAAAAVVIGGFGAPFAVAIFGNTALASLYAKLFGQPFATDWQAGLSAPFVEESAKGAAFLLLMGLAPVVVRTAYDGLIVGAYTGLGFQVVEDMLYGQNAAAAQFGVDQAQSVLDTFALRSLTGVASHALYTALFGAGLIYLIGTVAQPRRVGRGLALVLAAVGIHLVWDSAAALSGGNALLIPLILVLTTVGSVVILIVALRLGAGREREFMRAVMAPEVGDGVLTEPELDALAGGRRDRRAALRRRATGTSRRRERHVLHAARDLAADLCASGGTDTAQVAHSRAEIARIRNTA